MILSIEFDAADVFGGINQNMERVNNNHLAKVSLRARVVTG